MTIWSRIIPLPHGEMPAEAASYLLRVGFRDEDQARIDELSARAREGSLSETEREDLEEYIRINHFLTVLHANVRRGLNPTRGVA